MSAVRGTPKKSAGEGTEFVKGTIIISAA